MAQQGRSVKDVMKQTGERQGGMQKGSITKYRPFPQIELPDRQWPSRTISQAPIWCSVDLRDGNQALPIPMSVEEKVELFETLVAIGFKEIEVGFPSASQIEFDFIRRLIDEHRIPDDVTIQVLVQAREELIRRTVESLKGAKRAIIHLYNSTSPAQRRMVFQMDKQQIVDIAVRGTEIVKSLLPELEGTHVTFQYSPESFSLTEIDFSVEICQAVVDTWQPTPERKMILNLPETVQIATPNVHADQIEWFCKHLNNRESVIISLHTHNDRGTGVASTEMGLLAGAERVEGTIFGNGERTGNVDIVTVALNMYMSGVDPLLNFDNLDEIREVYERTTRMTVPVRHPYAGELVFTAFSGSHQDAINKGLALQQADNAVWEVPYLPIDPQDIGRSYEAIIRINSQSGKGGVAYVLETEFGYQLPKAMHPEVGKKINEVADATGEELTPSQIFEVFQKEYLLNTPFVLERFDANTDGITVTCQATIAQVESDAEKVAISGQGNGPVDAFVHGLREALGLADLEIGTYAQHSLDDGANARAVTYVQVRTGGEQRFGAAIATNVELASIRAVVSAVNRLTVVRENLYNTAAV